MCFFGGGRSTAPSPPQYQSTATAGASQNETTQFDDSPPVVTGRQTGVENPKDTKKATEELKIRRLKREGKYVEPKKATDLSAVEEKLIEPTRKSGGGNKTAQQKANLAANKKKAKSLALARKMKKTAPKNQGAGAMRSDIRLKENIKQIGLSELGYKIYEFNYKNDDTRYRGAMAQDVITKLPKAISLQDGYLYVNYDMIDINMEAI